MKRFVLGLAVLFLLAAAALAVAATQLPAIGAGALLFPTRHATARRPPSSCVEKQFTGAGLVLGGWQCTTPSAVRRGTIVYLHGIADNRGSATGVIERFVPAGFDVIAYDGRAHGTSGGDRCTYGFHEKRDLQLVLDQTGRNDVVAIGHSLGAAIALQAAAVEPRIRAVVAVSTFSDLRTIATERAWYFPAWSLPSAFARAERDGAFVVDEVSPVKAAALIAAPVLLVHGDRDVNTPPSHSQRVFEALRSSKRLLVVPGADHMNVLNSARIKRQRRRGSPTDSRS
jgi:pimeloyl-ACP methyl ester carboxylesterase